MPAQISVIIPAYNPPREHLAPLYDSLMQQSVQDFEVLLVDDGSTRADYSLVLDPRFRVLRQPENRGPAACRNAGAAAAKTPLLFFTDIDCTLAPETLAMAVSALRQDPIVLGDTVTDVKTALGRAIALLGFPGGGILGFDRVWRVDGEGRSASFSSCNVAFRKETFEALGGFNCSFPVPGGEDTVLARQAFEQGITMRYQPRQVVYHVERASLKSFLRWQVVRGRGNYYIKQHVASVGGYLRLRLWTYRNSFRAAGLRYGPAVFVLLTLSVLLQVWGFQLEKRRVARGHGSGES